MCTSLLLVAISMLAITSPAWAGPPVYVGTNVPAAQRKTMNEIDHHLWDQLLHEYVDDQGQVAYGPWKARSGHVRALEAYLGLLSKADRSRPASREARLAFWINAYNAVTIRGILREYPTTSIRNHTAKFYGYNIWKDLQLIVGEEPISLDDMEHEVLRKMNEPRIHFAIVCASHSCPKLRNEAYVPDRLEEQLEDNTRDFFAKAENFRFDVADGRFYLSSILDWFEDDFGSSSAERLKRIAPWLPTSAQDQAATGQGKIRFLDYDWSLNERRSKPAKSPESP